MGRYMAEIISDPDKWDLYKEDWNELLERSSFNDIFLTFEWLRNWWRFFGKGKLSIVLIRDSNKMIAALPLYIARVGFFRVVKFIGTGESDYGGFIIDKTLDDEFYKYILKFIEMELSWDAADLREIPEVSPLYKFLEGYMQAEEELQSCKYELSDTCKCFYIPYRKADDSLLKTNSSLTKTDSSFAKVNSSFVKANSFVNYEVAKAILAQMKVKEKKLRKRGRLTFEIIKLPDDGLQNLFSRTHIERWKRDRVISNFSFYKYRAFHSEIIKEFERKGSLYFVALKIEDKYISFAYCFLYNKKVYGYLSAYDLEFYRFSPGNLVFKYIIEKNFNSGIEEIDLLRGGEEYKKCWSEYFRINHRFFAVRNSTAGILYKAFNNFFACLEKFKLTRKACHFCSKVYKKISLILNPKNRLDYQI